MATSEIFFIIASVGVVIVVILLVPVLTQVRKTVEKADVVLDKINNELEPLLHNATEVRAELNTLSKNLNAKIEKADEIIGTVQQAADSILATVNLIKSTATPLIVQIGAISAGIGAFTSFFKKSEPTERRYFDE